MNNSHLTLQNTLALAIILIGFIGIALVFITDYTYRELAHEQQKDATKNLISITSSDLIKTLVSRQKDLAYRLQTEPGFKQALDTENTKEITYWLDQEFNRYYVTIGLIKLEKIIIYNENFEAIASSERGIDIIGDRNLPCSNIVQRVKSLSNIHRTKPNSSLCEYDNQTLSSTLVSIGSLKPQGYIHVITSPAFILTNIEKKLGLPLEILDRKNKLLHQSFNWPTVNLPEDYLISTYTILDDEHQPFLKVRGALKISSFSVNLNQTRYKVILGATVLTLLTLLFGLAILHRGLLPLNKLRIAANSSARGEFTSVEEKGYSEISSPIHAFNTMVTKIQTLISDLKNEVIKHEVTEKKYKQAKENAEIHAQNVKKQSNFLHMTLQSIVDGVITTDTHGYVQTINPMAEQLTGWTAAEAKNKPLVQVMHALRDDTQRRIYNPTENIEFKSVLDDPVNAILIQNHSNVETPIEYIAAPMRDHDDKIAGIVIIIHDESVQRSLNRQLTFQATHDALTGLINRYEFERRLKNVLTTQSKEKSINTLCYIDLDQFKLVNDTCGHSAGDELLKEITQLLNNNLEGIGLLARLGGDEFGLLLKDCDAIKAQVIAKNLLEIIQQFNFTWHDNTFSIGASIGIAPIAESMKSCEEILSNADSACYLAKETGRNRVQVFTEEDDKLLTQQREMHWVSRINHALEENRFLLYFQEITPLKKQSQSFIRHGEILLRMVDKDGDIVSPNNFLPAAERYNMITPIDEWVVNNSIKWLASRKDKVLISVNLSGTSVSSKDFLNYVLTKIKQHKINPELLCFEITETAAIDNLNTAIHFMNVLKKLGCSFALDDFGSGLSSFSYLNSLPVDYLKIDGAFVMDIDKDPMHYAMVKSINEVGQTMGIKTIAEYAASESIIECLRAVGVDNAQGYAIARPTPLSSLSQNHDTNQVLQDTASAE